MEDLFKRGLVTPRSSPLVLSYIGDHYSSRIATFSCFSLDDIVRRCHDISFARVRGIIEAMAQNARAGQPSQSGEPIKPFNRRVCGSLVKLLVYAKQHPDKFPEARLTPTLEELTALLRIYDN